MKKFKLFTRTWWEWKKDENGDKYLDGKIGKKNHVGYAATIEEARDRCEKYNNKNYGKPSNPLARMMEFQSI